MGQEVVCQCEVGRLTNDHWQYVGKNVNICLSNGLVLDVLDSHEPRFCALYSIFSVHG